MPPLPFQLASEASQTSQSLFRNFGFECLVKSSLFRCPPILMSLLFCSPLNPGLLLLLRSFPRTIWWLYPPNCYSTSTFQYLLKTFSTIQLLRASHWLPICWVTLQSTESYLSLLIVDLSTMLILLLLSFSNPCKCRTFPFWLDTFWLFFQLLPFRHLILGYILH